MRRQASLSLSLSLSPVFCSSSAMAEPLLHTDKDPQHSKSAFFFESFTLPFTNSSNQALPEACNEVPTNCPRKANADLGTDCAMFAHPGAFFEVPNSPSTTDCARFAHPDALFQVPNPSSTTGCAWAGHPDEELEVTRAQSKADFTGFDLNAQARADSTGFAHQDALSEDPHAQLTADCAGFVHADALFEAPKAQPIAVYSWFAHLHAISADSSAPVRADCTGFAHPDALFQGLDTQVRENCAGSAYPQENCKEEHVQSSAAYAHKCEEYTHLHKEFADSTEACGNDRDCTCARVGSVDEWDAKGGVSYREASRGDIANTLEDIRDTCGVLAYPCVEVAERSLPCLSSEPQPSVSECSSATSMVTDTILESMSKSNDPNMDTRFTETHWTDAKHRSYLTFMEANFVKVLYGKAYCALDVCGQVPCHPGSSSPPLPSTQLKFKSGQSGDWWMTPERPFPACIPSALLKSPWVNPFRPCNSANACHQIKDENTGTSIDMDESEEEVNSPLTFISHAEEPLKGNVMIRRHQNARRSKMGLLEKHMSKDGSNGGVGELKEDVLQEFAHATVHSTTSLPHSKKRKFQPDCEQNPYTGASEKNRNRTMMSTEIDR